jgi:dipeptide transport system substrate-binding protein
MWSFALFITALTLLNAQVMASTLVYCSEGSPVAFNPQITTDGTSNNAASNTVYNRLLEFDYGGVELTPALAESFEVSDDQLTYTFKLRANVHFHTTSYFTPTRTMNADDVLFSFMRMHDRNHPYHSVGGGQYEYYNGMGMRELIESIEKIDDLTVRIKLKRPEAPFLANLAMSFMSILSAEYADQLTKRKAQAEIDHQPVGTGPFVFRRYRRDSQIRYDAHPKFWGGAIALRQLVISITPDASVRLQKLRVGECHVIIEPSPSDLESMRADQNITLLSSPGFNTGYLAMNTQKAPFDNPLVRKAVSLALNRDSYLEAIYFNNAVIAQGPLPPGTWATHSNLPPIERNLERAQELLAQAGFPNGFETELWTLPVSRPYNPAGRRMGEMMQADLAQIGIRVRLVTYDWGTYLSRSREGEHTLIQLGWTGDNGDPDNFLHTLLGCEGVEGGSNVARFCHKEFNDRVMKAKLTTNIEQRKAYYLRAQEIFREELPWVPLAHATLFRGIRNNVQGFKIHPIGGDQFRWTSLK